MNRLESRSASWRRQLERDLVSSKKLALLFVVGSFKDGLLWGLYSISVVVKAYLASEQSNDFGSPPALSGETGGQKPVPQVASIGNVLRLWEP